MNIFNLKLALPLLLLLVVALRADAGVLPIGPTKIPFYTGNLSVNAFMVYWGTNKHAIPASDWASPEHIEVLKRIGVFADCDYQAWSLAQQEPGKWDFSLYEKNADLLHAAGFEYIPFCWVHFPPKWYLNSPDFVPYECAEHGEKLMQLSPWAPNVWEIYRRFYSAQHKAMGDKIDWIRIATPSDYGEIGYPAAMTSWLVPQKHAHKGFWCGGSYARADFRDQMKRTLGSLSALNQRWGTSLVSWSEVTYPDLVDNAAAKTARKSGKAVDRRRWLDFIDWYNGVWLRFVPKLTSLIREFYPDNPMIVSVGYGAEDNEYGNDFSAIAKMANRIGVALQTPGNVPYYAMKRVSTACHLYHTPYYTEPPGDVPPDAEAARVFNDVSNGVQVYFEYPQNLDRARTQLRAYKNYMTGVQPVVDFAIFNPVIQHRLDCAGGFPTHAYHLGHFGREYFDYDVVDETMVVDGALSNYRLLAYVQGNVTEKDSLRAIADWVKRGGALLTCDLGDVETVEGDASIWNSLIPDGLPQLDAVRPNGKWDWAKVAHTCARSIGRGIVIQLPVKPDQHEVLAEAASYVTHNLSSFGPGFADAPLIDGKVDGVSATLLPDRILYFTWLDKEVTKKVAFRETDWASRRRRPEKMEYDLKLKPHSMAEIPLK